MVPIISKKTDSVKTTIVKDDWQFIQFELVWFKTAQYIEIAQMYIYRYAYRNSLQ